MLEEAGTGARRASMAGVLAGGATRGSSGKAGACAQRQAWRRHISMLLGASLDARARLLLEGALRHGIRAAWAACCCNIK